MLSWRTSGLFRCLAGDSCYSVVFFDIFPLKFCFRSRFSSVFLSTAYFLYPGATALDGEYVSTYFLATS